MAVKLFRRGGTARRSTEDILDELDERLREIRNLPGLPRLPDITTAQEELLPLLNKMAPAAVDAYGADMCDDFVDNDVKRRFESWKHDAYPMHNQAIIALGSLHSKVAGEAHAANIHADGGAEHVEVAQARIKAVIDNSGDPDAPVFAPPAGARTSHLRGAAHPGQQTPGGLNGQNHTAGPPAASDQRSAWPAATSVAAANPAELAPRHWTGLIYLLVLLVAAGIDIATFYQVFALVVYDVPDWVVWLGVVGFTTTALSLAHWVGVQVRHQVTRHRPVLTSPGVWIPFAIWLFVGATAFVIRGVAPPPSAAGSEIVVDGSTQSVFTGPSSWLPALLFLALYLATGALAATGAYHRHNPHARILQQGQKDLNAKVETHATLANTHTRARHMEAEIVAERKRREDAWEDAVGTQWKAFAESLKKWARLTLL